MTWSANPDVRQIQLAYPIPKSDVEQKEKYSLEIVGRWLESASGPIQPDLIQSENAPIIDLRVDVDVRRETGMFWVRATLSESADMAEVERRITEALETLDGFDLESAFKSLAASIVQFQRLGQSTWLSPQSRRGPVNLDQYP
jgi:hypothetical protein